MKTSWNNLQQVSKASLGALVVVLAVVIGMEVVGDAPSPGIIAGFVVAAAALVGYTEWTAGKEG